VAIDRTILTDRVGRLTEGELDLVFEGIDVVLGRA